MFPDTLPYYQLEQPLFELLSSRHSTSILSAIKYQLISRLVEPIGTQEHPQRKESMTHMYTYILQLFLMGGGGGGGVGDKYDIDVSRSLFFP